jgi:hypothetical protein
MLGGGQVLEEPGLEDPPRVVVHEVLQLAGQLPQLRLLLGLEGLGGGCQDVLLGLGPGLVLVVLDHPVLYPQHGVLRYRVLPHQHLLLLEDLVLLLGVVQLQLVYCAELAGL